MATPRVIGSRPQPTTSGRRRQHRFSPFTPPTRPPAGTYDPGIDAQAGAALRGLQDLRIDTEVGNTRAREDYDTSVGLLGRGRDRSLEDLLTTETRGNEDFGRTEGRGRQDYGIATEDLGRQFGELGRRQAEGARAAGVTSSGIAALSAGKRAENQGREQSRLDLSLNRLLEDVSTGRTRLGQDVGRGRTRVGEDYQSGLDDLNRGLSRGIEDRSLGLGRAEREGSFFDADAAAQRFYQAAAQGYEPPTPRSRPAPSARFGGNLRFRR